METGGVLGGVGQKGVQDDFWFLAWSSCVGDCVSIPGLEKKRKKWSLKGDQRGGASKGKRI